MRHDLQLISRRQLLRSAGLAGGGLLIGCTSAGKPHFSCCTTDATTLAASEPAMLSQWIQITPANDVIMFLDKVEMGQGVMTSHAMLVAEELEIGLDDMTVLAAPVGDRYANREMDIPVQMTGGSTSVAASWNPLRQAAAQARERLKEQAALRWGMDDRSQCKVVGKTIACDGRSARFAELAGNACEMAEIPGVRPRTDDFRIIGAWQTRLDAKDKVTGAAIFGIDVTVPDALVAVVVRPSILGARITRYDGISALAQTGCIACIEIPNHGIAVVADTFWHAQKAARQLKFDEISENAVLEINNIENDRRQKLCDETRLSNAVGDVKEVDEVYEVPFVPHATMEPMNCTADVTKDHCRLWAPTQWPSGAEEVAAEITGLPTSSIDVKTTFLGGGFGRRIYQDYVVEAVTISKELQRPVKVYWTREDDFRNDYYRPSSSHRVHAAIDDGHAIVAWKHSIRTQSIQAEIAWDVVEDVLPDWLSIPSPLKNRLGKKAGTFFQRVYDPTSKEGTDLPYTSEGVRPDVDVEHDDLHVPVGYWRSVGHSQNAFVVESMIDELAHEAGIEDALEFRLMLLRKNSSDRDRLVHVLEQVRDRYDWTARRQEGHALGVAAHQSFGTYCAQVVEVAKGPDDALSVARVDCVVDCGIVVNPDLVKAQMEGAIIFGLSATLKQEITIEQGRIVQSNFHNADILRMHECPKINVYVVKSTEEPTGVGEPGVPPVAPAVCNALFAATDVRIRQLPIARCKEVAPRMGLVHV